MECKGWWEVKLDGKVEMKWRPRIGAVKFLGVLGENASRLWVDRERIEVENQEAILELRLDSK